MIAMAAKTATPVHFEPGDRVRFREPSVWNRRSGTVLARVVSSDTLVRVRWDNVKNARTVNEARLKKSDQEEPCRQQQTK